MSMYSVKILVIIELERMAVNICKKSSVFLRINQFSIRIMQLYFLNLIFFAVFRESPDKQNFFLSCSPPQAGNMTITIVLTAFSAI